LMYSESYYSTLRQMLGFFTREGARGYAFATAADQRLMRGINASLIEQAQAKGKQIKVVFLQSESDQPVMEQIRRSATQADGLIIGNLDELIVETAGEILLHLNFSRESLQALGQPLLFWVSKNHLPFLSNRAADLFSQRALSTFVFDDSMLQEHLSPALDRRFQEEAYKTKEEYKAVELRIKLLEKQLQEAEEADVSPQRIANDLALPLAEAYLENQMYGAALNLIKRYGNSAPITLNNLLVQGKAFQKAHLWDAAQKTLRKALHQLSNENKLDSAKIYGVMATVYMEKGEIDNAIKYYYKSLEIKKSIPEVEDSALATTYHNLSIAYRKKGDFPSSLAYEEKARRIWEEQYKSSHPNLAATFNHLAVTYQQIGQLDKALFFQLKAVSMAEQLFDNSHPSLARAYDNLSSIYLDLGNLSDALTFQLKAIDIRRRVQDEQQHELALSYSHASKILYELGNYSEALSYAESAKRIFETSYSQGHPHLVEALENFRHIESKLQEKY